MAFDILAVTGSRADWGLLVPILRAVRDDPAFQLRLAATGQHLMTSSISLDEIQADGFVLDYRIDISLTDDTPLTVTRSIGLAIIRFAELLERARPDLIMLLGDRFEIYAVASAALVAKVPVVHFCGGDLTGGAIDDAFRHSITKMAHLHFVTSSDSARRVVQLGEDPSRVITVGSPALDRFNEIKPIPREAFFASIGLEPQPRNLLITFHPATLADDSKEQCLAMLEALEALSNVGMIFTGSNSDPGARAIETIVWNFASTRANAVFISSLGFERYVTALRHVDAVVGNSSSGIYEAPSFGIPTVNIGNRQKGRLRAASVIDCEPNAGAIADAIGRAMTLNCSNVKNPYGDGHAAERVVAVLRGVENPTALIAKTFRDCRQ
jgi:UDP-hydrolysing UDP-N-acetyl-D-glucosamine 2-epimerase